MVRISAALIGCGMALWGNAALAQTGSYKVVYTFTGGANGYYPQGSLINVGDTLFGTTGAGGSGGGTIFSLDPSTGKAQIYPLLQTVGAYPQSNLLDFRGTLYGTATEGVDDAKCKGGCGTVFTVDPATGAQNLLYSFPTIKHGTNPTAGLINIAGTLYGTTPTGGRVADCPHVKRGPAAGCGTVFSLNPNRGKEKVLYAFQGGRDGAHPAAGLINVGGMLYGTTASGGASGLGTVFSLNPANGAEKIVYAFEGSGDGATPKAGLLDVDGVVFGTTTYGGSSCSCGTVFSLNPATGVFKVVYAFKVSPDGQSPFASLLNVGKTLYGTTYTGGTGRSGTLFSVDIATGKEVVLHSFEGGRRWKRARIRPHRCGRHAVWDDQHGRQSKRRSGTVLRMRYGVRVYTLEAVQLSLGGRRRDFRAAGISE